MESVFFFDFGPVLDGVRNHASVIFALSIGLACGVICVYRLVYWLGFATRGEWALRAKRRGSGRANDTCKECGVEILWGSRCSDCKKNLS